MKRYTATIICVVMLSVVTSAFSKEYPKTVQHACKNYLFALRMDNEGVVESTIFNIMKLKLVYPDLEYDQLAAVLDSIAQNSDKKELRQKAYLACMFLRHPEHFNWITKGTYDQNNAFFELVSLKLAQKDEYFRNEYVINDSTK